MITPNSGIASFLAPNRNKLTVPFMRYNWLSNRIFTSHDTIIDHCCQAWNKRIDQPWRIMTIGRRQWAHGS